MSAFRLPILCSLLLAIGIVGCDTTATQPADSQVFVESYQRAGAPLDTVWLKRTVGARETITPSEAAVENAAVEIENLDTDNTISYTEASAPGAYVPAGASPPTVQPQTSYRLRIETDDGETVTSTTTVPKAFTLEDVENATAAFGDTTEAGQPSFVLNPPAAASQAYEQDRQNVYFFTVTATGGLNPGTLTPFYRDSYDADEDSIASFRVNSSGLLNQANFSSRGSGKVSVDLPWIGVAFFGTNEVGINLVDDNYYDFLRSESAQENAPPGEFPNIIDHVENGTGIFASYVREARTVQVQCNEQFLGGDRACPQP